MTDDLSRRLDWATPTKPAFDLAALARTLGLLRPDADTRSSCRARRWGRCPGTEFCPDCPWAEGGEH